MKTKKCKLVVAGLLCLSACGVFGNTIALDGEWQMRVDDKGEGVAQKFFAETFSGETGVLPGTNHDNLKNETSNRRDMANSTEPRSYRGSIWYQREIEIDDLSKEYILFMERCGWESFIWVNGKYAGTQNSLVAPHEHNLTKSLKKGKNQLTVLFDNLNRKGRGVAPGDNEMVLHYDLTTDVKKSAKLNCGGHNLVHNWNGAIGKIELRVFDKTHIVKADVFSDIQKSEINVKVLIANANKKAEEIKITAEVDGQKKTAQFKLSGAVEQTVEFSMPIKNAKLWSEFNPALYTLKLAMGDQQTETQFGMRELKSDGIQMMLNGKRISLRGTLECMFYPILGHEPMDVASWKKQIGIAQSYGLNYFRFHTGCPPDAAFQAADELGFYLQVEVPGTSCPSTKREEDAATTQYLTDELKRIIYYYGNHPSFMLASMGNEQLIMQGEPDFIERQTARLAEKVQYGQTTDPRHLYSSTTHPWTSDRIDDFYSSAWGTQKEHLCGVKWGGGPVKGYEPFNKEGYRYGSAFDFAGRLEGLNRPLITHENGQWCVYADFREITRYYGAMRAYNYEDFQKDLCKKGLGDWANDFTLASGKLTLLLYKAEIEALLCTPELSGFQLLSLQDYPGQGTSPIGIINAMWESKGLTTPAEFRQFCSDFVPMARLEKMVWDNSETFKADLQISNYSAADFTGEMNWALRNKIGQVVASGNLKKVNAPTGQLSSAGEINIPLGDIKTATALELVVSASNGRVNRYNIWVYPQQNQVDIPEGVMFATAWDDSVEAALENGVKVVCAPSAKAFKDSVPGTFSGTFWNARMKHRQISKTMGLLIDSANPALADFPSEFHSDWQWQDLVNRSFSVRIESLPLAIRPAVRTVDNFHHNRSLAMIFEFKYKNGSVLVCTADIVNDLETRPEARQLRKSLLNYAASPLFKPDVPVTPEAMQEFLGRTDR
ncbi:Beta-galactosidase [Pontiella desulfatans]|uniref:Beta-galactosidase n=2 Tax=Pontiella desulfatans TaxID=2750659 RepID=A0A6C2U2H1_PONDE|nr:Beta-galactosidase [Pontiella desulfatans]